MTIIKNDNSETKINPFAIDNDVILDFEQCKKRINDCPAFAKLGKGIKIITFKADEFKKELAPQNANIQHIEVDGIKKVRMIY